MPSFIICATALDLATTSGSGNSRDSSDCRFAAPKMRRATSRILDSAWIVPVGRYRCPPGARHSFSRMLSSIAAGSSAPVGPPARPSGNQPASLPISSGIPDTSPMITSACSPRTGSSRFPLRNSTSSCRPRRTAFCFATSIASSDRSIPITRLAPSLAATNESTPLPQPTSITVSPGSISSASAIVRLVCVGWKTPVPQRDGERAGPALPLQHGFGRLVAHPYMVAAAPRGSQPSRRDSHLRRHEHGVLAGGHLARFDPGRERVGSVRHADVSTPRWPEGYARIRPDARRSNRIAPWALPLSRWT